LAQNRLPGGAACSLIVISMCRWITLLASEPYSLSDILLTSSNALVQLSKDASFHPGFTDMNNHVMNGDGFGVGWYHHNVVVDAESVSGSPYKNTLTNGNKEDKQHKPTFAAVFKDTQPAWNNINLREICIAVKSDCMMAHVRAASPGSGISQQNCHPFKAGRLLFCHNGRIDRFSVLRRRFLAEVSDEAFMGLRGTTDSECIFAIILTYLDQMKEPSEVSPIYQTTPFGHKRLVAVIKKVLRCIERVVEEANLPDYTFSTCNFSLTDGESVVVTRFCDRSSNVPPPSLYFAFGKSQSLYDELTNEEPAMQYAKQTSAISSAGSGTNLDSMGHATDTTDSSNSEYEERPVELEYNESLPGVVFTDVNPTTASFVVASNPLTRTHTWHPMPKNSVMWCNRGSHPELRLLKRRKATMSYM